MWISIYVDSNTCHFSDIIQLISVLSDIDVIAFGLYWYLLKTFVTIFVGFYALQEWI